MNKLPNVVIDYLAVQIQCQCSPPIRSAYLSAFRNLSQGLSHELKGKNWITQDGKDSDIRYRHGVSVFVSFFQ